MFRYLPRFWYKKIFFCDQISTKILVRKTKEKILEIRSDSVVRVKTRGGHIIIWLLCRLLRPLLGAETWDRRCACASGWSIYGLQPLKAGRGDSLLPLVELLLIRNLVRTRGKLAAAAALQVADKCGADRLEARCDDSWRLETDPAGRSTAARRRTIRTQERALFKQLGELITLFTTTRRLALLDGSSFWSRLTAALT